MSEIPVRHREVADDLSREYGGVRISPLGYACRHCGGVNVWRNANWAWNQVMGPDAGRIRVELQDGCVECGRLQREQPDREWGDWACKWCVAVWPDTRSSYGKCGVCAKHQTPTGERPGPRRSGKSRRAGS
jgi:hypothetical protein